MEHEKAENFLFSYTNVNHRVFMQNFHYHDNHELYFLVDGTVKYMIGDEIFCVRKGNFVFVPKGIPHKTDSEACCRNERMLVCFDDSVFCDGLTDILADFTKDKLICVEKTQLPVIAEILRKIQQEYGKDSPYKNAMIKAHIKQLLIGHVSKAKHTVVNDALCSNAQQHAKVAPQAQCVGTETPGCFGVLCQSFHG